MGVYIADKTDATFGRKKQQQHLHEEAEFIPTGSEKVRAMLKLPSTYLAKVCLKCYLKHWK